ncbi:MAG TPA: hypothetical protein VIM73_19220 [Polyangiaceae bacterium]|jgi:hypothetical protein
MAITNTLKTGLRAGVVALALAGSTLVATAPVQAQSNPSFGFSLNFSNGQPTGGIRLHFGDEDYFDYCRTNSQIIRSLRNKGYRNVQIVRENNRTDKVWVVARKSGDWYQMRVDRCTGKVDRIREIFRKPNGSFTLNFSF